MLQNQFTPTEVREYEHATWSRCTRSYAEGFGALAAEAIDPLLSRVRFEPGQRVLDLGTGPGLAAAVAFERGADVVGIDFSEPMIAAAKRSHPGIEFHVVDAESLPFEDETFDAVIGNFVLHHSGEPDRLLAEARRVLRPEGRAGFTIWGEPASLEAFGLFFAAVTERVGAAELPHGPLFGMTDADALRRLMETAGFRDASVEALPIVWRTRSLDPYLAAFSDWAKLEVLRAEDRSSIEATVRQRAEAYRGSGGFEIPNPAILVAAAR